MPAASSAGWVLAVAVVAVVAVVGPVVVAAAAAVDPVAVVAAADPVAGRLPEAGGRQIPLRHMP